MLTWEPDSERVLESTFLDSIPFLLFASDDFRDELLMRLRGLVTYCNTLPRSIDQFLEEHKRIKQMLTCNDDFGELSNVHIAHLQSRLQPINHTLTNHSLKIKELEKIVNDLSKNGSKISDLKSLKINPTDIGQARTSPERAMVSAPQIPINNQKLENLSSINGKVNYRQIVIDCLKSSPKPMDYVQIIELTGLSKSKVKTALGGLMHDHKKNVVIEKQDREMEYNNSLTGILEYRKSTVNCYTWVDSDTKTKETSEDVSFEDNTPTTALQIYNTLVDSDTVTNVALEDDSSENKNPLALQIYNYIRSQKPRIITQKELSEKLNTSPKNVSNGTNSLLNSHKYAEVAKRINAVKKYSGNSVGRKATGFQWIEPEEIKEAFNNIEISE